MEEETKPAKPRKRFVGKKAAAKKENDSGTIAVEDTPLQVQNKKNSSSSSTHLSSQVPPEILNDPLLNAAIAKLPPNYNFEMHKCVWRMKKVEAKRVGIQFPEGLQMFACTIADIFEQFAGVDTIILGDVTYGACCVDDFSAKAVGCDFLIHYGHSCLVPIDRTSIQTMYVFVDISIDTQHFIETVRKNFQPQSKLALCSTIQFVTALQSAKEVLQSEYQLTVPQSKPLSPGELLGCTAPRLGPQDALVYLADGRFHLEAIMIANPDIPAYRYDPYNKEVTIEKYQIEEMHTLRKSAIERASKAKKFGLILGTLGRQGNNKILTQIESQFKKNNLEYVIVLLSEIFPSKLEMFKDIECWVQVACPRLSIDWGYGFEKPLLSPYELNVVLKNIEWQDVYPMDYYANDSLGPWTNKHISHRT
eukprot:Lithocolla_globosa_v1_NODE_1524_length_2514_cov_7.238308.p1 type:complete len:420 gc:universal NODE_1524_length_2514_cov_7.238308:432-1691(+)